MAVLGRGVACGGGDQSRLFQQAGRAAKKRLRRNGRLMVTAACADHTMPQQVLVQVLMQNDLTATAVEFDLSQLAVVERLFDVRQADAGDLCGFRL